MKKAIISTGAKQYLVAEGDTIRVELLNEAGKTVDFVPLAVIDGDTTTIGTPEVKGGKVTATVSEEIFREDKVTSIRFKAKKRVHKRRGHRQQKTVLTITRIA